MKKNIPNILTIIRVILIPVFVLFYIFDINDWQLWAGIVFLAASITDFLDGYLARKWNVVSTFGKFVDPIADKLLVLAALLILLDDGIVAMAVVLVLLAREFLISGFRLVAVSKGVIIAADKSGKIKTATQMLAIIIILLSPALFGNIGLTVGIILMYISVALSVYSCIEYLCKNKSVFNDN